MKKFNKFIKYNMYMHLLDEDVLINKNNEKALSDNNDNSVSAKNNKEDEKEKDAGFFHSDNVDIQKIHNKLISNFKASEIIYGSGE